MHHLQYGSPTLELFVASYNNRSNKANIIILEVDKDGYKYNTSEGWLNVEENHGIYNKSTSNIWWLASPDYVNTCDELFVNGARGYFHGGNVAINSFAVRPMVCIPTSVFNSKYGTEANLVDE